MIFCRLVANNNVQVLIFMPLHSTQVLRNHNVRKIQSLTDTWVEANDHTVEMTISMECGESERCSKVRNLIIEKLDSSVQCSIIKCSHTPEWKARKT